MASDRFALTWYGNKIYFDDVSRSVFDIRDIAHAAAVMPRWTGHTNWEEDGFAYSVGQHGLWCEHYTWLQNGTRLERKCALLHDAAESFIGDLNTNAKRVCEDYRLLEDELLAGIFAAVGLPVNWAYDLPPIVKEADAAALSYEAAALCNRKMTAYISPPKERVTQLGVYPLHPRATKQMFLDRYQSLSLNGDIRQ